MRWDHAQTPYEILGLDRTATADAITIAYKQLIVEVHPDRDSSVEALKRFKRIRDAFELLEDSRRRSEYDEMFRRDDPGTTGVAWADSLTIRTGPSKKRRARDIALEDASWKHELMSESQFDLILKLQKQVYGITTFEIEWNLLFRDADDVAPSKGNAGLLIDYLLDLEALGRQYGSRWEELVRERICSFETIELHHPRLSGSPFHLPGWSIRDSYFRGVFDRYKALHIAEAQRLAKLESDRQLRIAENAERLARLATDRGLLTSALETIRLICLSLLEVHEVPTRLGTTFTAGRRVFARANNKIDFIGIAFRATTDNADLLLSDTRFCTCSIADDRASRWICRRMQPIPDRHELEPLILASYRLVALKRMLKAFESSRPEVQTD